MAIQCGARAACDRHCVDPLTDDANCGGCGHACPGAQHCSAGSCRASKIEHVILIVQENHTFDQYFGRYCEAPPGSNPSCTAGPACCEAAPVVDPSGTPYLPLTEALETSADADHDEACEVLQINGGAMDRFTSGTDLGGTLCSAKCSNPTNFSLADASTVGFYWDLAPKSALADRFFQPTVGGSGANNLYFATAHKLFKDNDVLPAAIANGCSNPLGQLGICVGASSPGFIYKYQTTIADLLLAAGAGFAVYADGYAEAVAAAPQCPPIPPECPFPADQVLNRQTCVYAPDDLPFSYFASLVDGPAFKDYSQLAADLAGGKLPAFSFVKARTYRNEHPRWAPIAWGATFVSDTLATIAGSPYAGSTLVLVTFDEGGGFFDHVPPPPPTDRDEEDRPVQHGTRVPFLAVGPFARQGAVSHVVMDHASIVRFLEYNFLGPTGQLGYADAVVNNLGSLLEPAATGVDVPEGR